MKEPSLLPKREIALQPVDGKSYVRHLSFPSMSLLYKYILSRPPLHLYYSSGIYDNPSSENMEAKGWLGSDLVFDIDSDHYPGCSDVVRVCPRCGAVVNMDSNKCPSCGSEDIVKIPLFDEKCLEMAWNDVIKIINVMEIDFGAKQYEVAFSGHRGFHVRFEDDFLRVLGRDERRAIVDYLMLRNVSLEKILMPSGRGKKKNKVLFFKKNEYGFRARLRDSIMNVLEYRDLGEVIEVDYGEVKKIAEFWRVELDPVVTMDITRLSRFIGSVNGKAGLAVCKLDPNKAYEPVFDKYVVFQGYALVVPRIDLPEINILGKKVRLRRGEKTKLDATIVFYLAVRGLVDVIDYSGVEVVEPCR